MKNDQGNAAILIVEPLGTDADLVASVLAQEKISAELCCDLAEAATRLAASPAALMLAQETLHSAQLPALLETIRSQPALSILLLIDRAQPLRAELLEVFGPNVNVTLLERPLQSLVLVAAIRAALRSRRRQEEIRDLIAQREAVLGSVSDAFSSIDREWRYTYVNERVATLAGLPKEKILGRNVWEIFPEAVGTEFYHLAHQAMDERRAVQAELFHKPWGRWLDTRIYPTKDGIAIFRADVTERKHQQLLAHDRGVQLRKSEDLLRLATEAADIGTFDFYPATGEVVWSERCKEVFGLLPQADVSYQTYIDAVHPDDRHIVHETVRNVLQPGSNGRYDIEYRTIGVSDGRERWIAEKGRAIFDESGKAIRFIGTMLEITERKTAEIALQRANREAEEANQAKDQFLAMLSHELRTPLTPVLMTIAALRRQPEIADTFRADLEVLQRNVELEALLIDDLLDLTRIAHGKLQLRLDAVDLHTVLEHALSISALELQQKKLQVTRRFEAAEHHAWADGARLQQVFWNLIKNAVKFTPENGSLQVATHNDGTQLVIEISDNGVGIEAELLPKIFDAFEQGGRSVTSQYGGLGLGLAISKRVIDLHGGEIKASSAGRGHGATFTVRLQAMQTSMLEGPVFLPNETQAPSSIHILLIEDHADSAYVLRRVLEQAGYSVEHVSCITDALALAQERLFDLVISDLGLPDGSGLELMQSLRATHGLSGIALSGFGMEDDHAASAAAGFAEHLTKPVDWPQLRAALERVLSQRPRRSLAEPVRR